MELTGINVSVYQGDIAWTTIESIGNIKFAMIKATYGKNGVDPKFTANMTGINTTTIPAGAYHYFTAQTPSEAVTEANHFINTIKPYKISYPLALSLNNEDLIPLGKQKLTENVIAFLKVITNSDYIPILFTNLGFINNYLDMERLEKTEIWLAEWGPKPTYTNNVTIWQYKNTGKVYGIDTDVDMNISYKDYTKTTVETPPVNNNHNNTNNSNINIEISSNNHGNFVKNNDGTNHGNVAQNTINIGTTNNNNNGKEFSQNETQRVAAMSNKTNFYTVKSGENLRSIAKKLLGNPERYQEIMMINGLEKPNIYVGQTIRIPKKLDGKTFLYRVVRGDSLWALAEKYLGNGHNYHQIMSVNGLTSDMIYPGQILKIPTLT